MLSKIIYIDTAKKLISHTILHVVDPYNKSRPIQYRAIIKAESSFSFGNFMKNLGLHF